LGLLIWRFGGLGKITKLNSSNTKPLRFRPTLPARPSLSLKSPSYRDSINH